MDDRVDVSLKLADKKLCKWCVIFVIELQVAVTIGTQATLRIAYRINVIEHIATISQQPNITKERP